MRKGVESLAKGKARATFWHLEGRTGDSFLSAPALEQPDGGGPLVRGLRAEAAQPHVRD